MYDPPKGDGNAPRFIARQQVGTVRRRGSFLEIASAIARNAFLCRVQRRGGTAVCQSPLTYPGPRIIVSPLKRQQILLELLVQIFGVDNPKFSLNDAGPE